MVGGGILLFGAAWTLHLNREGQITHRFTRVIDQLGQTGDEKLDVRLGGIYALERTRSGLPSVGRRDRRRRDLGRFLDGQGWLLERELRARP